ncbi:hypothetical protein B0H13DRAFT_1669614 [Mycena leptocephala]|nr:hypothetical protein B0H13DRAFT_1669614 [Mycena leptocephala]
MSQLYTEHILKLPDGINILYTDSGAPNTPDYTTIVVLHGTGFNGYSFVRLHEYDHKYNLRIVICNRRDYRGSTKYSNDELADLQAGRQSFQHLLGLQTAWFLEHFIKHENTPKVTTDGRAGGFILVGWSFGNATTLALLAEADMIPRQLYKILEPHLRSLVLYDPPSLALGYRAPVHDGLPNPLNNPDCTTPDETYEHFEKWVSSYYTHPDIAAGCPSGLSLENCTEKRTINQWTEEEKARYSDKAAAIRVDWSA